MGASPGHSAFELLAPGLQRQLYAMKWPALRPIQVDAIKRFLGSDHHLLLMAETAAGKTEAAFLPVLSSIAQEPTGSVRAIYVGPLKALINDQFSRIERLCTHLEMPVHRWHGDVGAAKKEALIRRPGGVLLITPESLESLLVNRTAHLAPLFGGLRAVVIDELHAFLGGERGLHLASLLRRIARYHDPAEPDARMIGLSATIGDASIGRSYLAPDDPATVEVIRSEGEGADLGLRVHGYDAIALSAQREPAPDAEGDEPIGVVNRAIAEDLAEHCRGHSNLVFANAKGDIEIFADLANEVCDETRAPRSFLVHHGSLAREVREDAEARMRSSTPYTTICSSTLEMGIDIGSVHQVGQIGAPWSVASLKQRAGRSGRADGAMRRLRCYVDCTYAPDSTIPTGSLPLDLLQTVAVCELMIRHWVEPPFDDVLDLSTLTHQVISTIAECGASAAATLYQRLCVEGPFRSVATPIFARLLRALGAADIVEQEPGGRLILGLDGERLRARRDFYAAFATPTEFSVVAESRTLGSLPLVTLPKDGDHIVFAGRRWQVSEVDTERREVRVVAAKRRKRTIFAGSAGLVHHRVRDEMMQVLARDDIPVYLDPVARNALVEAREHAHDHDLARRHVVEINATSCLWLTWTGTIETMYRIALLEACGIESRDDGVAIRCACSSQTLQRTLDGVTSEMPSMTAITARVTPKQRRKYDDVLPDDLLDEGFAQQFWRCSL